jgi:hypothetical protein
MIHDLQHKLDHIKQVNLLIFSNKLNNSFFLSSKEFNDAEQQIYKLHQDKLTLIKAFTTIQDNKPSGGDHSIRSNFVTRN